MPDFSKPIRWRFQEPLPADLVKGCHEVQERFPERFSFSKRSASLTFAQTDSLQRGWRAQGGENGLVVEYARSSDAFRGLGMLMGQALEKAAAPVREERCGFEKLGVMLDTSRNGVPKVETLRKLIVSFALLGLNWLMLYTEETYEVPGEPLFGYFRGRYSRRELEEIDAYAALFGIEVIPCIQTLGHLGQLLRWPAYANVRDTSEVLFAGERATEELVVKMIEAASAPFRTRRIHVGMDEAHGIGSGNYRQQNGYKPPFEILTRHLEYVASCCERLGLRPMIWSDMYFRLGSKTDRYYDRESQIPDEVSKAIPNNVELVYWDYYHQDEGFYREWIRRHRAMGKEPILAAGVWSWSRFWTALPHSFATVEAGMKAAFDEKLQEAFTTVWGDDGMECDLYSTLPAIARFADLGYGGNDRITTRFSLRGSADADLDTWVKGSGLDCIPGVGDAESISANFSKWMLWHDPVLRFLGRHIPAEAAAHYRALSEELRAMSKESVSARRLRFPSLIAEVLSAKLSLSESVDLAYSTQDGKMAGEVLRHSLPDFCAGVRRLWKYHRELWHELYKPFGWEVLERRYGALLARCETLRLLLEGLEADPEHRIEEFEQKIEFIFEPDALNEACLTYAAVSSPSIIF